MSAISRAKKFNSITLEYYLKIDGMKALAVVLFIFATRRVLRVGVTIEIMPTLFYGKTLLTIAFAASSVGGGHQVISSLNSPDEKPSTKSTRPRSLLIKEAYQLKERLVCKSNGIVFHFAVIKTAAARWRRIVSHCYTHPSFAHANGRRHCKAVRYFRRAIA